MVMFGPPPFNFATILVRCLLNSPSKSEETRPPEVRASRLTADESGKPTLTFPPEVLRTQSPAGAEAKSAETFPPELLA